MGRTSETRVIDGIEVTATQLPPLTAFPLWLRVSGIIASLLSKVDLAELRSLLTRKALDVGTLALIVQELRADDALLRDLLASCAVRVGKAKEQEIVDLETDSDINRAFAGKLATMVKAAFFAGQVNFAGPFAELFGAAMSADETEETTDRPSEGSS